MPTRQLGSSGPTVSMIGLGCVGMSDGERDDDESTATIRPAIDSGITLLDTRDFYGAGHDEMLIRRAIDGIDRSAVQLSVTFGGMRGPDGSWGGIDARPAAMATSSRTRYSEVGADTIRAAAATHPIADLQIEYSLRSRGIEATILPTVRELGIGITAYAVPSRGLITLTASVDPERRRRGCGATTTGRSRDAEPSLGRCDAGRRRTVDSQRPSKKASWTPWFSGMSQKSMIRPSGPKQTESRWHATVRVPTQRSAARVPAFCVRHRADLAIPRSVRTI
jgi:aryl-alcohol dehydrogenase-like predicted oxidoreductase